MKTLAAALLSLSLSSLAGCNSNTNGPVGSSCGATKECASGEACVIVNGNDLGQCEVTCDGGDSCDAGSCMSATPVEICDASSCSANVCE